jgi:ABC-2 type transport system permease protein
MLRAAWQLARKDLRIFFRDRTGMLLGFALPIALVGIFGFIMGALGGKGDKDLSPIEVAVLDEDVSPASATFVQALRDSPSVAPVFAKEGAFTRDELQEHVSDGKEAFAVIVPKGFADGADLVLLRDPGRSLEARLVEFGLVAALFKARGGDAAWDMARRGLAQAGLSPEDTARAESLMAPLRLGLDSMFSQAESEGRLGSATEGKDGQEPDAFGFMERALPLQLQDVAPAGRDQQINYYVSHAVSGMTVMMLLFTLTGAARSLLTERDKGTLRRLLAAPMRPGAILLGKFLMAWLLGLVLVAVLYAFAWLVFHVDIVSRWDTLLVISAVTAAACTSFAIAIAAWARTDKQADGVSTLIILSMSALGGSWFPTIAMPPAAQTVAKFTLTYWSLRGYQGTLWYGKTWTDPDVLLSLGVVMAVAVALGVLATVLFRRRYLAG